jgi:hypothetical protein
MRAFWKRRKDIAQQGAEVSAIADALVAEREAEVDAIIIDMSFQFDSTDFNFHVHYSGIDEALRRGLVMDYIPASRRKLVKYGHYIGPAWGISERYEELDKIRSIGADGKITELAAEILASGKVDAQQIRSQLSVSYDVVVELPGASTSTFLTFYWRDGTIYSEIYKHGTLDWVRNVLVLYGIDVPEAKRVTSIGQPLSNLVELPFGGSIVVDQIDRIGEKLRLSFPEKLLMIDLTSGNTWDCPVDLH